MHVAPANAFADREFLVANAFAGLATLIAFGLILHYGSFARILAACGLSPAG
jgi:hypothetical protein